MDKMLHRPDDWKKINDYITQVMKKKEEEDEHIPHIRSMQFQQGIGKHKGSSDHPLASTQIPNDKSHAHK